MDTMELIILTWRWVCGWAISAYLFYLCARNFNSGIKYQSNIEYLCFWGAMLIIVFIGSCFVNGVFSL